MALWNRPVFSQTLPRRLYATAESAWSSRMRSASFSTSGYSPILKALRARTRISGVVIAFICRSSRDARSPPR